MAISLTGFILVLCFVLVKCSTDSKVDEAQRVQQDSLGRRVLILEFCFDDCLLYHLFWLIGMWVLKSRRSIDLKRRGRAIPVMCTQPTRGVSFFFGA